MSLFHLSLSSGKQKEAQLSRVFVLEFHFAPVSGEASVALH